MRTTRSGHRSSRTDMFSAELLDAAPPEEQEKTRWVLLDDVIRNQEVGKAAMRAQSKAAEDWYRQRQKQLIKENEMLATLVKHTDNHQDHQVAAAQLEASERLPEEFIESLRESRSEVSAQVVPVLINTLKGFCIAAFLVLVMAASKLVPRPEHCAHVFPFTPHDGTPNAAAEMHACAAGKAGSALEAKEKDFAKRERVYLAQKEELNQLQARHKQQVAALENRLVQHEEEKKAWAGRQNSTVACDGDLRDERLALEASLAQHRAEKAAFQQALAEHESLRTALETKQREFSGLQAAFEAEKIQFQEEKDALEQQRRFETESIESQKTLHDAQKAELEKQKVQFQSDQEQARELQLELAKARAELEEQEQSQAQAKAELGLAMRNVSESMQLYRRSMEELEQMQKQHQSQKQELERLQEQHATNEAALEEQRQRQQSLRESFELQVAEHERARQAYDERASAQLAEAEAWKSEQLAKEREMERDASERAAALQAGRLQLQAEREAFEVQLAKHLEAKAQFDQTQSLALMRQRLKDKRGMQRDKDSAHAAEASVVRNKASVYEAAASLAQSAWNVLSCLAVLYASASILVLIWWVGSRLPRSPQTPELKRTASSTSTLDTHRRNISVPPDASSPRSKTKKWLSDDTLKDMRERETWSVRQNRVFSETPYEANEEEKGAKLRSKLVAPTIITSVESAEEADSIYSQEDGVSETPRAFVDLQVRSGMVVVGDAQESRRRNNTTLARKEATAKPRNASSASRTSPKALRVDTVEAEAPLKPGPGVGASSPPSSGSMNSFSNYISSDAKTRQHALSDTGSVLVSTNWKERSPSKNNSLLGPCPEEHAVQDAASPPSSLLDTHDRTSFSNARKGYTPTKERGVLEDEVVTAPRTGDTPGAAVGSDQALRDVWTGLANEARPPVHEEHEEAGRVHQPGSGPDAPIARNNFDVDESRSPNAGAGAKAKLIFSSHESAPAEAHPTCVHSPPSTPPTHLSSAATTSTLDTMGEDHRPASDHMHVIGEPEQAVQEASPQVQSSNSNAPSAVSTLHGILNGAFDNFLIQRLRASREAPQDQQETSGTTNHESDEDSVSSLQDCTIRTPQQKSPASLRANIEPACMDELPDPKPKTGGPPRCATSSPTSKSVHSIKSDRGSASKTKANVAANLNARAARPLSGPVRTSPMAKSIIKTVNSTVGTAKVQPSSRNLSSANTKNRGAGVQTSPAKTALMEKVTASTRKSASADQIPSPPPTTPSKPVVQKCTRSVYTKAQMTAMELISKRKISRDLR